MFEVVIEKKLILLNKKVIIKLITPCTNFNKEYLNTDILCLLVKDVVWAIIDKPEKEHKKLIKLNLSE